ncbi:Bug family tripartite tricarboxylate transporter substrate binding protein [Haloarcula salina]|uniref:Tripartite tricarboxylate transporter substrate binding protein n=1 Tax=Haloarcula salina TaxID=1429914 RepID=A0AA41G3D4_9EURY|nr:tripartite tricarboxylate transporter substrate binding protein [Haloarcula salina]MBV0902703.1 tripartite tricarboxylate transporter substrate binding protein [Haloarcula salina]
MVDNTSSGTSDRTVVNRRNLLRSLGAGGIAMTAGCMSSLSGQQEWPARPIEIVSPWAAGGGADRTSRAVASAGENYTDVAWNVSNQTGGSGSVGMNAAANADPDGHTIGVAAPEIALFEHLGIADLSPDDITPIMQYTEFPAALLVHEDAEFSTVQEWREYGQSNTYQMANSGFGSSWHMAAAAIASEAGVQVEHVSYDGAAPAMQAVVNQEADCTAVGAAEAAAQVRDGPLQALGVAFDKQVEALPDTPTLTAEGLEVRIGSWLGHFVQSDISDERKQQITEVYNSIYEDEGFVEFMNNNDFIRVQRGPEEFNSFLEQQYEYYGNLVDELGIEEQ